MEGGVRWSLIVPSHNGEDTLPACLGALEAVRPPAGGLELLVIDNASTDGTADLLRNFAARTGAPFLSEPRKGKSYALNTAIDQARGEMLVFLDDDVIAEPGLVEAYAAEARDHPDAGVFAGQIRPRWPENPPGWLDALTDEGRSCGCTEKGLEAGWQDPHNVKGGNMCIRRSALGPERFATKGVNFGAVDRAVGGEDSELVRRLAARHRIRFVPGAKVHHIVGPHEMTWKGVFARYVRIGRGNAAQGLTGPGAMPVALRAVVRAGLAAIAFALGRRTAAARQGTHLAMGVGALDHLLRPRDDA